MPHAPPNEAETAPNPPDPTSPPSSGSRPEVQPANAGSKPGGNGNLFRALVNAGADAIVAYTAEKGMQSMVSAEVATAVQPILLEMRQLFAAQEQRFAAQEQRFAAEIRKTNELVAVKLDAIRRELRLIWGALGVLLTMWLAVLGYLLAGLTSRRCRSGPFPGTRSHEPAVRGPGSSTKARGSQWRTIRTLWRSRDRDD